MLASSISEVQVMILSRKWEEREKLEKERELVLISIIHYPTIKLSIASLLQSTASHCLYSSNTFSQAFLHSELLLHRQAPSRRLCNKKYIKKEVLINNK